MPEVKMGVGGGWVQAFCRFCGWASQSRDLDRALSANLKHERGHPEWTKPEPLSTFPPAVDAVARHATNQHEPSTRVENPEAIR